MEQRGPWDVVTAAGERGPLEAGFWGDLASLTRPLFTAREVLPAAGERRLDLGDPLAPTCPTSRGAGDGAAAPHAAATPDPHLRPARGGDPGADAPGNLAPARSDRVVYSDPGYILPGMVLERVRGRPLREFALDPGLTFPPA